MFILRWFNRLANLAARVLMAILISAIVLLMFGSVAARNIWNHSLEFSVEGCQVLFVWACFIGLAHVHYGRALIRFELLEGRLPPGWRRPWRRALLTLELATALILVWGGWKTLAFAGSQRFSTMPISYFWLYLPVPAAGALIAARSLENLLDCGRAREID